jgi:hypothetical protein
MNHSDDLEHMLQQMSPQFEQVLLRGCGRARFLFAQHHGRAVEISESEGKWWLEFWDADPDVDAAPVKELTLQTTQETVKAARDWLASEPGQAVLADTKREVPGS